MGCPLRVRVSTPGLPERLHDVPWRLPARLHDVPWRTTLVLVALCTAACSGGNPEAGAAGTAGSADAPIAVSISNTYLTVENRTGAPLLDGEMVITQVGVRPPFRANLPRLENGMTRDFTLNTFRAADGTLFNRTIARAKSLKLTAKDVNGKTYEQEVPFN